MSVTVRLDDNIEDVVDDVEETIESLRVRLHNNISTFMEVIESAAKRYIRDDAELSGQLRRALEVRDGFDRDPDNYFVSVVVDNTMAGYGAIIEYGSGSKTNETSPKANSEHVSNLGTPPGDFPYNAPSIGDASMSNPTFVAFVSHIKEWMIEKNIEPEKESLQASAQAITHEIVTEGTYAHPYLRPAWFDHERAMQRAVRRAVRGAFD